jgi:hypothetical protein
MNNVGMIASLISSVRTFETELENEKVFLVRVAANFYRGCRLAYKTVGMIFRVLDVRDKRLKLETVNCK